MATFVLDDFATDMERRDLTANTQGAVYQAIGDRLARRVILSVTADPYDQEGSVGINSGLLLVSAGFKAMSGLQLLYGEGIAEGNGENFLTPFRLDLTRYSELVLSFMGSTQDLNINVVMYSHSGRTAWGANQKFVSCGVDKKTGLCFTRVGQDNPQQLVIPISHFTEGSPTHPSYDPAEIGNIHIGIQNLGYQGGHAYAIDRIELK